jgi:photosystem II stability/assembly factor-like uncharacterized protein
MTPRVKRFAALSLSLAGVGLFAALLPRLGGPAAPSGHLAPHNAEKPWKSWRPGGVPAMEKPDDWFFRQRAFPYREIPARESREALAAAATFNALHRDETRGTWQEAGPSNVHGRITDIAVHPDFENIIYAGAADGGVFRSSDGGATWVARFDAQPNLSIGALAVHPDDVNTVYVGTGEANAAGDTYAGDGVWKSTNGGLTWQHLGLEDTHMIGRIAIDPVDPDRIFVAAMGALYSTNPERGLYRSTDGGGSWELVLFVNDSTGVVDVAVNPQDPGVIYAAAWERIRRPSDRRAGGFGSGIYKSVDGGDSWTLLGGGLPAPGPTVGRIGLSVSESQPNVVYAIYANHPGYFSGVYKTTNGGTNWSRVNDGALADLYSSFGWYFGQIRVSPVNPNVVFVLGVPLYGSTNGGTSWSDRSGSMHVDHHALYIHPNGTLVYDGNDGGFYRSLNGGTSWTKRGQLPITQFYAITVDEQLPERLYGGTQDNSTCRTLDGTLDDWDVIYYGDGFYTLVDPTNSNVIYAEYQYGGLGKSTDGGNSWDTVLNGINDNDRRNWSTPVEMDPSNPQKLYYGTYRVYRSTNGAGSWSAVSGDLTDGVSSGNLVYNTITTIDVSPADPSVIYAGTDDGNVWVTLNGGSNWTNITATLPDRWVTRVTADPIDPETAYVTISGYKFDESIPHVFRTTDAGASWQDIASNLPPVPLNDVLVDPEDTNVLYVASDAGVYWSPSLGSAWLPVGDGLPNSAVNDLHLHNGERKLVAGTHGRSMFTFDLNDIAVGVDVVTAATVPPRVSARPNPMASSTVLTVSSPGAGRVSAELFDVRGRLVARLADQDFPGGELEIPWDGADLSGRPVASGSYLYRVRTEAGQTVGRLVVSR